MQVQHAYPSPFKQRLSCFVLKFFKNPFFLDLLFGCNVAGCGQLACIAGAWHAMAIARHPCIHSVFDLGQAWYAICDGCKVEHTTEFRESSIDGGGPAMPVAGFINVPGCFHALFCRELDAFKQAGRLPRQHVKPIARIQTLHGVRNARSKSAIPIKHKNRTHDCN